MPHGKSDSLADEEVAIEYRFEALRLAIQLATVSDVASLLDAAGRIEQYALGSSPR